MRKVLLTRSIALSVVAVVFSACSGNHTMPAGPRAPSTVGAAAPAAATSAGLTLSPNFLRFTTLGSAKTFTASVASATTLYASSADPTRATVSPSSSKVDPSHPATFTVTSVSFNNVVITVTNRVGLSGSALAVISPWLDKAPLPLPSPSGIGTFGVDGTATLNGVLYADEYNSDGSAKAFYAYNATTDAWTAKAPLPSWRAGVGFAELNGLLYAVGGADFSGFPIETVQTYDANTNTWTDKASVPTRGVYSVGVIGKLLYAVGTDYYSGDVSYAYNPSKNQWTQLPAPTDIYGGPVYGGTVAVVGNNLLLINASYASGILVYDPNGKKWSVKLPQPNISPTSITVLSGTVYALTCGAACSFSGELFGSPLYAYNATTNAWVKQNAPVPIPYIDQYLGSAGNSLYIVPQGDPCSYLGYTCRTSTYAWTP